MALQLPDDFKEFLKLLTSHEARYLLIGGFAVGYHGYPRTTKDIDLWVEVDLDNAKRLVAAIKEFGFSMPELTKICFWSQARSFGWGFRRCGSRCLRVSPASSSSNAMLAELKTSWTVWP